MLGPTWGAGLCVLSPRLVGYALRTFCGAHRMQLANDTHSENRVEELTMWYFSWILGVGFACAFGIINAMWLEAECDFDHCDMDKAMPGEKCDES